MSTKLDFASSNYIDIPKASKLVVMNIKNEVLLDKTFPFNGLRISWDESNQTVKLIINE